MRALARSNPLLGPLGEISPQGSIDASGIVVSLHYTFLECFFQPRLYVTELDSHHGAPLLVRCSRQWIGTRFHSRRDGNREVYVMDADGQNPVNVSNDPGGDWEARWQPLGRGFLVEPLGQRLTRWGSDQANCIVAKLSQSIQPRDVDTIYPVGRLPCDD